MKKLLSLFVALIATCALWASNVITYTATEKLPETNNNGNPGLYVSAFMGGDTRLSITSHTFSNGEGTITLSGDVTSFGMYTFSGCTGLTSINIPNSVTAIGFCSFLECTALTSVTLPSALKEIGSATFNGCSALASISIPSSVTEIGMDAFSGCSSLPVENDLRYADTYLVEAADKSLSTYTIKDGTKWIGSSAFYGCSNMTSITIPNSVTVILNQAFKNCTKLTSINIPNSVKSIVEEVFYGCSALTSVTLPEDLTDISAETFCLCTSLASINIPKTVVNIKRKAFEGCLKLNRINLPDGLQSIGQDAFNGCSFSSITIPESVTYIAWYAFANCSSLTSISIPETITEIEDNTFSGCALLSKVVLPSGLLSIGKSAFNGCKSLTEVVLPDGVKEIGDEAYHNCPAITSVSFGKSLTKIGYNAFYKSEKIKVLDFPSSLKEIDFTAFPSSAPIDSVYVYNTIQTMKSPTNISNLVVYMSPFDIDDDSAVKQTILNNKKSSTNLIRRVSPTSTQIASVGPTSVEIVVDLSEYTNLPDSLSLDMEDAEYPLNHGVTHLYATGLKPNSKNTFRFYSKNEGETSWTDGQPLEVTTSALTLKTENPRVISAGSAIVAATTNISDIETNVGFEWRKTDAPAEMASKRGNAIIYNGMMEGKLQNLATTNYWKVRAYYQAADETEYYGDWVAFDPSDFSYFEPTVHTYTLSSTPTSNSVMVRGYVMTGTDNVTEQGFEYWFSAPKGIAQRIAAATPDSIYRTQANGQIMTAVLENLAYSTVYHCRAYAIAGGKTFYGEDVQFLTAEDPRPIVTLVLTQPENGSINMDAAGEYREGDSITLIATPNSGYSFEAWSDGVTDNPYSFVITEDMELTAVFVVGTDILNTELQSYVTKVLRDGQLLIQRDGKTYNMQGAQVE